MPRDIVDSVPPTFSIGRSDSSWMEPEIQKVVNLEKDAEEIHEEIEIKNGLEEVVKEGLKEITS
ncbi:hypothetical protein J6590_074288 [Homalodisca vitripennis]|nr:hypothetical protein J6590_074288 [Homalodisca vitripennis]